MKKYLVLLGLCLYCVGAQAQNTLAGNLTVQQTIKLTGSLTPPTITSSVNDYAPTGFATAAVVRVQSDAPRSITGLAGGAAGRMVWLTNVGTQAVTLATESASSTAANRFSFGASSFDLLPGASVSIWYDTTSSRWRAATNLAVGGGGGTTDQVARDAAAAAQATADAAETPTGAQAKADAAQAYSVQRANHTGTQAATTITTDSTHRFTTDTEKTSWDAKQDALINATTLGKITESAGLPLWDGAAWPGGGSGGTGTVTSVSVVSANGVSGSVATATTTPAITLSLGAVTPSSVAAVGTVTGSNLSGTNTGDQTSVTGNAGTATKLATARTINGVSFDGTANITVPAAAGTLTGTTLASGVTGSSLTSAAGGSFGTAAFTASTAYDPAGAAAAITLTGLGGVPTTRTVNGHALSSNITVTTSDVGAEAALGNPASNGYVLSSTTGGTRSWVAQTVTPVGANPSASVGLSAVNGSAATFLRSDGAPALDQAINPTWSGTHTFSNTVSAKALAVTGTAGAGFITLPAQVSNPTAPAAGTILLHANTANGITRLEQDNEATTNLVYGRDSVFIGRNTTGVTITKGQVVYTSGVASGVPEVTPARANSGNTLPALGVALDNIAHNAYGQVMTNGVMTMNTTTFSDGDNVWVSPTTAGAMIATRPSGGTNYVQRVGTVLVSGTSGTLLVGVAPAVLNQETGTNAATWTGKALAGDSLTLITPLADAYVASAATWNAKQAGDTDLTALAGLSTTGILARTGAGTASTRTITGTTDQVVVTNGDGVSGNPTLALPQSIATTSTPTFAGLGVGTTTPSAAIHSDRGSGTLPALRSANTNIRISAPDAAPAAIEGVSFGQAGFSLRGVATGGTRAVPTATTTDLPILSLNAYGYDGTAFSDYQALYRIAADGLWSATSHGTFYSWVGTQNGSTSPVEWMRLYRGNLGIGTLLPSGVLDVAKPSSGGRIQVVNEGANVYNVIASVNAADSAYLPLTIRSNGQVSLSNYGAGTLVTDSSGTITAITQREVLTANRTYYVSTTGSDSANGLSVGAPFLTIQKAVDIVTGTLDHGIYNVTIQCDAGTYTAGAVMGFHVGSGYIELLGDPATPSNCVIAVSTAARCAQVGWIGWRIRGFRLTTTGSGLSCIYSTGNTARIRVENVEFGPSVVAHVEAQFNSIVDLTSYNVTGGAQYHLFTAYGSRVSSASFTCTVTGTPNFSNSFASCSSAASILASSTTYSGSATGTRYVVSGNGVVISGGSATHFPGSVAGSVTTGGQYF